MTNSQWSSGASGATAKSPYTRMEEKDKKPRKKPFDLVADLNESQPPTDTETNYNLRGAYAGK